MVRPPPAVILRPFTSSTVTAAKMAAVFGGAGSASSWSRERCSLALVARMSALAPGDMGAGITSGQGHQTEVWSDPDW